MKNNYFAEILKVNKVIFPYLISLSFFFLILESYMYTGFLKKYIFVDSRFFLFFSIISIILLLYLWIKDKNYRSGSLENFILSLNSLLILPIIIFYWIMLVSNIVKYSNYVFATFHIQPQNFLNILYLSLSLIILKFCRTPKTKEIFNKLLIVGKNNKNDPTPQIKYSFPARRRSWNPFGTSICLRLRSNLRSGISLSWDLKTVILICIFSLSLGYIVVNFFNTLNDTMTDLVYISAHPNYTYDQKMQAKWGVLYDIVTLVKDNTPDGSSILLPEDASPHTVDADSRYYRPFLGNRKLTNYYSGININDFDYILLAKGFLHPIYDTQYQKDYIWPDFTIKSEEVIFLERQEDGNYVKELLHSGYNPKDFKEKDVWGIIKMDK